MGPESHEPIGVRRAGVTRFVIPTITRSERMRRARPVRRDDRPVLELTVDGACSAISVRALEHPVDSRVILDATRGAVVVGPPLLPRSIVAAGADLGHLARQDGCGVGPGAVQIMPPASLADGHALVLIGAGDVLRAGGETFVLDEAQGSAAIVSGGREPVAMELTGTIDHAFYAVTREPSRDEALGPLETAEEGVRRFGFPESAGEGSAWTFVVTLEGEAPPLARPSLPTFDATGAPTPNAPLFEDVSAEAGISMVHLEGPDEQLDIRPTMGPGAAWGDVDGDGWVDLYLVQGGGRPESDPLPNRLYRNRGDGTFDEFPDAGGAGDTGAGMGALFFDADGDGDLDLYVANYGRDKLYANDGTGRFVDASARAGLTLDLWSAGVCAADYDADGDLDLYVTSYLDYDVEKMPPADELGRYQREDPVEMLPFAFPGGRNVFLRNDGELVFTDVTEELGLLDVQGRGMQPVFWDFDADGDQDLYVANDVSFNVLFRNEADGTFKDISFSTGLDDPRGGMGLAVGDVDADGDEDVFLTNWQLEANALYLNNRVRPAGSKHRRSTFRDDTVRSGLGPAGIGATSWSAVLFDVENDADLDLLVTNGYTSPDYASTGICVGQPNHLFLGTGNGRFEEVNAGAALSRPLASRAAAACDYDRDGRVDFAVTSNNGPVQLLANRTPAAGRWIIVRLRGKGANTRAIGAEVSVDGKLVRSVRAGSGYLACHANEVHFGLGDAKTPVEVEVRWPSGERTAHEVEELDRVVEIREP
ncbi:MAG: CRTAC1 family protein [bacterium]|nr:CRTAC1 family protein [bacterium]